MNLLVREVKVWRPLPREKQRPLRSPQAIQELPKDSPRNSYPGFSSGRPGTTPADDRYIVLQAKETGGRQREKSLDTRHRRLDDRYRVFTVTEDCTRWWSVCTTPCTVCTFNACPSEKAFLCGEPGTPELERQ
ncbi:hypothetical protein TNCV_2641441 [Trichonephila clavipes]|nr:hypothetical protein TNCV_2641441 [Trichonephila clavipes]